MNPVTSGKRRKSQIVFGEWKREIELHPGKKRKVKLYLVSGKGKYSYIRGEKKKSNGIWCMKKENPITSGQKKKCKIVLDG